MTSIDYNVQHAPVGAFASFTLGSFGAKGGLGLELGRPADESVYIGLETRAGGTYEALPFYEGSDNPALLYDQSAGDSKKSIHLLKAFEAGAIQRELGLASDQWKAGDLTFTIYSRYASISDPEKVPKSALRSALVPALLVELKIDNRGHARDRKAFFGFKGKNPFSGMRCLDSNLKQGYCGVGQGLSTAIVSKSDRVNSSQAFTIEDILDQSQKGKPLSFGIGGVAALVATAPAGKITTLRFAVCFYRGGVVTAGMSAEYLYTRLFPDIESVGVYALENSRQLIAEAKAADRKLAQSRLNSSQRWMLAHAVHSYYGSTQLLWAGQKPFWVVNEGEYRMMNTFDLTVDQLFFEMKLHPWTVRNELDWYAQRFSYQDKTRLPGQPELHPGGISFTHDMGVANVVWRQGASSYELPGLHGCFSHMTHEELVNWVLCGLVYAKKTSDRSWIRKNKLLFLACLQSMANRDHSDDAARIGVMRRDSSRCEGGSEITTYDSLDTSLGQARNNLYLAVKCWAAYVGLADFLKDKTDQKSADLSRRQADRAATTIAGALRPEGYLPAVLGEGVESRILPVVEGLVFPHQLGLKEAYAEKGPYGPMVRAIKTHIRTVLVSGTCLFTDGGMKISSTSNNSWLSKVYLCQFVIRQILGLKNPALHKKADATHCSWLLNPTQNYWAWSDQMISGVASGSKYYPRGVTAILWMEEK